MIGFLPLTTSFRAEPSKVSLDSLDLASMSSGFGKPHKNQSVDGHPIKIGGQSFTEGVGTHAESDYTVQLKKNATSFHAMVGMDDETGENRGQAVFKVFVDGHQKWSSGLMRTGDAAKELNVDLSGAQTIRIEMAETAAGMNYAHGDWADAYFTVLDARKPLKPIAAINEPTMPIAHMNLTKTEIHGATVVGCTPGNEFIFRIPTTGLAPLTFKVKGLPPSIALDSAKGILRGAAPEEGSYPVEITASGPGGTAKRTVTIVAGEHKLALTPPMGWNSWNVWGTSVTANKVRAAADAFQTTHLADFGYTYVNIDDAWEGGRSRSGEIETNSKFGDIASLATYVHSLGLKLGIYSSPGPKTCGGYTGSYEHEAQDAKTYADWGVDYLKYDWCSYGQEPHPAGLPGFEQPYKVMREALDAAPRDIVYSLCQYGMGDVYKWGHSDVGGNLWRTTGDINDSWSSMSSIGFSHSIRSPYVKPGGWDDPDMLVVGKLGWGDHPRQTRLTGNEQITHISLWSMLAAPLIIGCDLTQLDPFTADLLTNPDVVDVDQDPLGKAAVRTFQDGDVEVWTRPLANGGYAVGLFNRGPAKAKVTAVWERDLKTTGAMRIRDLWMRRNAGRSATGYSAEVPAHGAKLIKVWK